MSGNVEAEKRSLPGWSLARDNLKPPKKQGWECPAPTVEDWEDYQNWKNEQGKKDELPAATQFYLADMSLLFHRDPDVQLPWIHRVKCELPHRVGRLSGELPVKASFVGCALEDPDAEYEEFKRAMATIGIVLCRHIRQPPNRFEIAHLEQSDLVMVSGGCRRRLWETLSSDIVTSSVAEHVKWRYLQGAVIIAVGNAMSLITEKSWYPTEPDKPPVPFTGWKLFPHIVAPEDGEDDLEDLVEAFGGAGVVILGVHKGCGMIFNQDGLIEPVRGMVQEYRWDWQSKTVKRALLLGPPRGTGLICPLYAAMQRDASEDEKDTDVWSYALTPEEENEEEHLCEEFEENNLWVTMTDKEHFDKLKFEGNEAFKAGRADLAITKYEQAKVQLNHAAIRWTQLDSNSKEKLDSLGSLKKPRLPSEKKLLEVQQQKFGQKGDYRKTSMLVPLLLNLCAAYLLAYEQDEKRNATRQKAESTPASSSAETTLVAVRNNLVAAFRVANEALLLSRCTSAKAWYRRGCVFELMRDPGNALRDFEQGLLRAPGDKGITKKRDEMKPAAEKIAENLYYARHKELDEQECRLKVEGRRHLLLRGSFSDHFEDAGKQFSVGQPVARLVDGTLQDVDGRLDVLVDGTSRSTESCPYLHPHALWTWEFLIQRAPKLQFLHIEDVDLGSGPLEWLCKGLRVHKDVRTLRLVGAHFGPAGAKMLRNVFAQNQSLAEVVLESCGLLDSGLSEIAEGLKLNGGSLQTLSLKNNQFSSKRLGSFADVFCDQDCGLDLNDLDLSRNHFGVEGAKAIARIIGSSAHKLRILKLSDCLLDLASFWRLVGKLDDSRPLAKLDMSCNPIGRGTRRCWRSTMGPTIRCEVIMSNHPAQARKLAVKDAAERSDAHFPLPRYWA